jgi:hypothetical protein
VNAFQIREAEPTDAAGLVALARAVSREPEGWLLSSEEWRAPAAERR